MLYCQPAVLFYNQFSRGDAGGTIRQVQSVGSTCRNSINQELLSAGSEFTQTAYRNTAAVDNCSAAIGRMTSGNVGGLFGEVGHKQLFIS